MNDKSLIAIDAHRIAALVEEQIPLLAQNLRPDYLAALETSLTTETSERSRAVLEQLVTNAHLAASDSLPLCQDTGYVWVCLEVCGPDLIPADIFSGVNEAVERAYEASGLRMSILQDALLNRINTGNNCPAQCEILVLNHGDISRTNHSAILHIMLKGGGSDNASALRMLAPNSGIEGVVDFVVQAVVEKGANACPPLVLGVGVGGSFDTVAGLAKHALLRPLGTSHPDDEIASLEKELLDRINSLDIGPGGLGGVTTALGVHVESSPCHIASLPVAVNISCTALRSISIPL